MNLLSNSGNADKNCLPPVLNVEKMGQQAEVEKILLSTCMEQWLSKRSSEQEREYGGYAP